ncbi:hypothetical protein, partial [Erwinia amylovora]|uniref:hypothetical protein n=1 Tax=Erwinia amylovora TaxID=552 RepID=UPI003D6FF5A4
CGMGHTRAADGLNECLLDDAVLDIQGQLTCALFRCTPADAMGQAADILDLSHQHKTEKPYLQMQQKVTFRFGNILPCRKNFVNLRASVIMYFWNRLSRLF